MVVDGEVLVQRHVHHFLFLLRGFLGEQFPLRRVRLRLFLDPVSLRCLVLIQMHRITTESVLCCGSDSGGFCGDFAFIAASNRETCPFTSFNASVARL